MMLLWRMDIPVWLSFMRKWIDLIRKVNGTS
ncbi:Uncharacterised protein [Mycobacterium tuberculosis]|nr:Uncharacterised protein [Mycobacterium tuberculosis]